MSIFIKAAGAVSGALAISEYMPPKYKHMLGGPSLKVDLHTGAAAEGILTFVITMTVLWIVVKGPANSIVKTWMLAVATVALVTTGSGFTRPSMNPTNAAGAVGGVLAILEYMPPKYKHMLGGPSLKVDLHTGAVVEGILTFVITMAVLWIVVKGPANSIVKTWMLVVATVALVIKGSSFTGPSMNPANAAGAVGGALAILEYMPPKYTHMLGGPSLMVDPHQCAAAEGILTFVITMAVLWIVMKGPVNSIVKTWMLAVSTVTLVITGSDFIGPSMNPANVGRLPNF